MGGRETDCTGHSLPVYGAAVEELRRDGGILL